MNNQNSKIIVERFTAKQYIKKDFLIALLFLGLFLIIGFFEKNLFLSDGDFGLLEHENIWIFLAMNVIIPASIYKNFNILENRIDKNSIKKLKKFFGDFSSVKLIRILWNFSRVIGFCCFIGNSLQNAKIINQLPFDYWDSINYPASYITSRLYKLYLFSFFVPTVLIYILILIKSVSKLVVISDMKKYPIANFAQLNALCNFGLNILLTILLPFIAFSIAVYLVHERFDITTGTTIIISIICTVIYLSMYILLIKNFRASLSKYKSKHLKQINEKLSKIYHYILNSQFREMDSEKLEICLKEEKYLCEIKENIEKQSKFPHAVKALVTSMFPLLPTLIKIISSLETLFSN